MEEELGKLGVPAYDYHSYASLPRRDIRCINKDGLLDLEGIEQDIISMQHVPIPRIHDLLELNQLCASLVEFWSIDVTILAELMPYAVESRYDLDFSPDQATATAACSLAEQVRAVVLAMLPLNELPTEPNVPTE